ncbi:hypothetical protein BJ684DRAFT_15332 [Piptocephalis cylindrospora]|uniref:Uncharacterized protein n=1 Tax=Piptocephalis cylindrospora TaxID=1907219 RepID=A0A4P9Y5V2_9FUNG|nr:hypothetical protein BJ684DRAFT_15332 [Piptocephalis cylindrospora]|eukprot:RKP14333.1 hypothetical protein BJ684DRAFT_15332 [Piptocephalis cylindrospora]
MSLGHHHSSREPPQLISGFVPKPPSSQLIFVESYMKENDYAVLTSAEQQEKYRPEYLIYKALFFMVGLEVNDNSNTPNERCRLDNAALTYRNSAIDACREIEGVEETYAKDRLLPRTPGSLIDIYCNIIKSHPYSYSFTSLVKAFHEKIGYSDFIHGQKKRDERSRSYKTKLFLMKHVSESIRKGERSKVFLYHIRESLQGAIYYLIMDRFYLDYHTTFGSLNNMLSSLYTIMRTFFNNSRPSLDRQDKSRGRQDKKLEEAERLMLWKLAKAKDRASGLAIQDAAYSAHFPSHSEFRAPLVKNFGDLFSPKNHIPPRSYEDIVGFVKKMCDQTESFSSRMTQFLREGFGAHNVHTVGHELKTPFYRRFCSNMSLKGAWTSVNGFNWEFSKRYAMSADELKDHDSEEQIYASEAKLIGGNLERCIYKVRLIQLIQFLRPHLVQLLGYIGDWDTVIPHASKQIRTLTISTYIHSVFLNLRLPKGPITLEMYQDMLNSISDASFVTKSKETEKKALAYLQTSVPRIDQMEEEIHSYQVKADVFWNSLSPQEKGDSSSLSWKEKTELRDLSQRKETYLTRLVGRRSGRDNHLTTEEAEDFGDLAHYERRKFASLSQQQEANLTRSLSEQEEKVSEYKKELASLSLQAKYPINLFLKKKENLARRIREKKEALVHRINEKNNYLAKVTKLKEGPLINLTPQEKERLTYLSQREKSHLAENSRKVNMREPCKERANETLRRALEWASAPEEESIEKNHAKTFAEHAVALKMSLLEAHKCEPVKIFSEDLSPQAVKKALSRKS